MAAATLTISYSRKMLAGPSIIRTGCPLRSIASWSSRHHVKPCARGWSRIRGVLVQTRSSLSHLTYPLPRLSRAGRSAQQRTSPHAGGDLSGFQIAQHPRMSPRSSGAARRSGGRGHQRTELPACYRGTSFRADALGRCRGENPPTRSRDGEPHRRVSLPMRVIGCRQRGCGLPLTRRINGRQEARLLFYPELREPRAGDCRPVWKDRT